MEGLDRQPENESIPKNLMTLAVYTLGIYWLSLFARTRVKGKKGGVMILL